MVKSKKMSKTSIAVIVLALLLVLSMVMGMTGAWFTAKQADDGSKHVDFGTVAINLLGSDVGFADGTHQNILGGETLTGNLMPGDHVDYSLNVNNTGDEAYILIHVTLSYTNTQHSANAGAFNEYYTVGENGAIVMLQENTLTGQGETRASVGKLAATNGMFQLDKTLYFNPAAYGNDYQGATVTLTYEVRAIQTKNLNNAMDAAELLYNGLDWTNNTGLASE